MILPLHAVAGLFTAATPELKKWGLAHRSVVMRVAGDALRAVRTNRLIILRMGLGRDSVAMLLLLIEGKIRLDGRVLQPCDVDAVVFTDPGAEWSNTYAVIPRVEDLCQRHGIRFIVQAKPPEQVWKPFLQEQTAKRMILREAAPKFVYEILPKQKGERKQGVVYRTDSPNLKLQVRQLQSGSSGFAVVGEDGTVMRTGLTESKAKGEAKKILGEKRIALPATERPWRTGEGGTIVEKAASGYYHERGPIMAEYMSRQALVRFSDASCSIVHKITPMYRLLADMQVERFGLRQKTKGNYARDFFQIQLNEWANEGNPPHVLLIGIAADEAERAAPCPVERQWERTVYPLIDLGITKADEAPILNRYGFGDVKKSGCTMCKFQPLAWYWVLSVTSPDKFSEVVAYEQEALKTSPANLIADKGVVAQDGWAGDPLKRKGITIDRAVQIWEDVNVPKGASKEQIDKIVEAVLSKAYKRCDRADGSIVKAAEPIPPPDEPKPNPKRTLTEQFKVDADRLMESLSADGFTLSTHAE